MESKNVCEKARMSGELQTLQQETAALKKDFKEQKATSRKVDEMRQNYPTILREIYHLKELKHDLQTEISALQKKPANAAAVKSLYETHTCRLDLLTKEAESLQQTKETLTGSLQQLKAKDSEYNQIQAEAQQIQERHSNLSLEVKHLQEEIHSFGDLREKLCAVKKATSITKAGTLFYEKQIEDLRSKLENLKQQKPVLEQEIQKLEQTRRENIQTEDKYVELLKKKLRLKKLNKTLEDQTSLIGDEEKQLLVQYDRVKAETAALEEETRRLQKLKATLTDSLQNMKSAFSDVNSAKENANKTNAGLSWEVTRLQEEIHSFGNVQEKLKAMKEENLRGEEDTVLYEKKTDELRSLLHDLCQQNKILEQEAKKLEKTQKTNKEMKEMYDNLLNENADYVKLNKIIRSQISEMRVQEKETIQLLNQYEKERSDAAFLKDEEKRLRQVKMELMNLLQNQKNLKSDFNNIKAENEKSKKTNEDLHLEVTQLQEEIQDSDDLQEKSRTVEEANPRPEEDAKTNTDLHLEEKESEPKERKSVSESPKSFANSSEYSGLDYYEDDIFYDSSSDKEEEDLEPKGRALRPEEDAETNTDLHLEEKESEPKERISVSESPKSFANSSEYPVVDDDEEYIFYDNSSDKEEEDLEPKGRASRPEEDAKTKTDLHLEEKEPEPKEASSGWLVSFLQEEEKRKKEEVTIKDANICGGTVGRKSPIKGFGFLPPIKGSGFLPPIEGSGFNTAKSSKVSINVKPKKEKAAKKKKKASKKAANEDLNFETLSDERF